MDPMIETRLPARPGVGTAPFDADARGRCHLLSHPDKFSAGLTGNFSTMAGGVLATALPFDGTLSSRHARHEDRRRSRTLARITSSSGLRASPCPCRVVGVLFQSAKDDSGRLRVRAPPYTQRSGLREYAFQNECSCAAGTTSLGRRGLAEASLPFPGPVPEKRISTILHRQCGIWEACIVLLAQIQF